MTIGPVRALAIPFRASDRFEERLADGVAEGHN